MEGSIVFAYHNPSACLKASLTESVKRAQTVFGHLNTKGLSECTGEFELYVGGVGNLNQFFVTW